ncbi:hypothetical protein ACSSS7_008325 [Eimeria intestinalis]
MEAKACAAGEQRIAVVSHQLDMARDPGLIRRLQEALQEQHQGQLRELEQAIRRRQRLLRTGGTVLSPSATQGPHLQLAGAVKSVKPLSILCCGGDVLLPSLTLQTAMHAFNGAESLRDIRDCGAPMPIKLLTAEPLAGSLHVAQKLLSLNAPQILKAPQQQQMPYADTAAKWRPIKELVERASAEPKEHQQQQQQQQQHQQQQQQQQQQQGVDSSKADENEALLLKAKLKETVKIVQTNVLALLPAQGAEDTDALLAVAEAHRLKPGGDIKQQLQELLQQQEQQQQQQQQQKGGFAGGLYRLQEAASLCVSLGLDNAGIGEGLLVYSRYAARALLTRRGAALLPSGLRVIGALLQLGKVAARGSSSNSCEAASAAPEAAAAALAGVWHCAAAAAAADTGDYFEVSLQDEAFTLLSDPVELLKADCRPHGASGARRRKETLSFSVKEEGIANCLALWFDFSLGHTTVSTQPQAVRRILLQQKGSSSSRPGPAAAEAAPDEAAAAATKAAAAEAGAGAVAAAARPAAAAAEAAAAEAAAGVYYTKAWRQAAIAIPPRLVSRGHSVSLRMLLGEATLGIAPEDAAHGNDGDTDGYESRMQQLWASLRSSHTKASEAWVRLFHSPPDPSSNKALTPQPAQIFEAAAALAWGPGEQRSFFLDPFEASAVFRGLFY